MKLWLLALFLMVPHLLIAQPMTVDADRFELVQGKQQADFFGHVVVKRNDMTLRADKVRVWYQDDAVTGKRTLKKVKAEGHVQIDTPDSKGASNIAIFTTGSEMLVMMGNAHMTSKQGTISGEHIEYNITTKDTKVVGTASGDQVRFTFDEDK